MKKHKLTKDDIAYNSLFTILAKDPRQVSSIVEYYESMKLEGVKPTHITYLQLFRYERMKIFL
jgi:hypothetical protein